MFSLVSGVWEYLWSKPQYNLLVIGLDNAGKSTFLFQLGQHFGHVRSEQSEMTERRSTEEMLRIQPTIGLGITRIECKSMRLQFWDLGGQTSLRELWEAYLDHDCHGIVYLIDSCDIDRIDESVRELHSVLKQVTSNRITTGISSGSNLRITEHHDCSDEMIIESMTVTKKTAEMGAGVSCESGSPIAQCSADQTQQSIPLPPCLVLCNKSDVTERALSLDQCRSYLSACLKGYGGRSEVLSVSCWKWTSLDTAINWICSALQSSIS